MRNRVALAAIVAALASTVPTAHSAPPAPQITDPAGDANGLANSPSAAAWDKSLPANAGSQAYADVTNVVWQKTTATKKVGRRTVTSVTGFTVTATLAGKLEPPAGTSLVFRMLADAPCGENLYFGVVYYTAKPGDPTQPQSALRDNCVNATTRLTPIALPKITDTSITWFVPLKSIPKETGVKLGTTLTTFYFEVRELQDFRGSCTPDNTPVYGRACGLAVGVLDNSPDHSGSFKLG